MVKPFEEDAKISMSLGLDVDKELVLVRPTASRPASSAVALFVGTWDSNPILRFLTLQIPFPVHATKREERRKLRKFST